MEAILTETRGQVALITLNNPDKLNALSAKMREEVGQAVEAAWKDDAIRALVVTGAGRGFCSGVDLSVPRGTTPATGGAGLYPDQNSKLDEMGWVGRWAKMWASFDKPVIAAVNGVCAGAGMSTALAADVRVGSAQTRFKTVFAERNLSPDSGMSYFLPRIVGYARAADLIFTSRSVGAEEALQLGLVNRLVPHEALVDEAVKLGEEMAQWPPLAVRMAKKVLQHNVAADLDEALKYESWGLSIARRATNDARESFAAFSEKRKPTYTGT